MRLEGSHEVPVAIVSATADANGAGESIIPVNYFRLLRERGVDVYLVTHERAQASIRSAFPGEEERLYFVRDTFLQQALWAMAEFFPGALFRWTFGFLIHLISKKHIRKMLLRLMREKAIGLVHEPAPVSPREPSLMYDLKIPVIVGPMNGGISYPPSLAHVFESRLERSYIKAAQKFAALANWCLPGKCRADFVLVANERTKRVLPCQVRGEVRVFPENGVDLSAWTRGKPHAEGCCRFGFMGRLIPWKGVQWVLRAFARLPAAVQEGGMDILGDGEYRGHLEALARKLGIESKVVFHGWHSRMECIELLQVCDVFVHPSVHECGGASVLEAMALELAPIVVDWGGAGGVCDAGLWFPACAGDGGGAC